MAKTVGEVCFGQTVLNTMDLFYKIHHNLPREGPGNDASTRKALGLVTATLPHNPRILDIGCGPGMQTLALAKAMPESSIVALDRHAPFLDTLRESAAAANITDQLHIEQGSMFALPFSNESFDLIWSEGAIYIIGFEEGLRQWRPYLKPGGCLAVSELTWLTPTPPKAAAGFWDEAYPGLVNLHENLHTIAEAGFKTLGHFTLPPEAWWTHYYTPIEARIQTLRQQYANDPVALQTLDEEQAEITLYRDHGDSYGYVFYVMQRL